MQNMMPYRAAGISESFLKVLRYALAYDCYLVRLDCDGEVIHDTALDIHCW